MSEENQTPVETPVESTNPPESKTIEIDGNSYSAEDIKSALYEANTKVENLENYWNNASKLLKS